MSPVSSIPVDDLSAWVDADTQRVAARMSQDIFGEIFRRAFTPDPEQLGKALVELESKCVNWCERGGSVESQILRLALLTSGLDQWGLAYTQAFNLTAIPALTALLGALRSRLNGHSDALFQQYFHLVEHVESAAIDFKVELRRSIHLALWHAMAACETEDEAHAILKSLGSMMVALDHHMPEFGWRLLADALAHIQICLLSEAGTTTLAQESTQQLFASLAHALPQERYQTMLRHAGQAVLAWQQARRSGELA